MGGGYGQFYWPGGKAVGAHRYSWILHNGREIPPGMQVMHSCDNPPCVNPAHLRVGTCADNMQDKATKGRNPGNRTTAREPRKVNVAQVRALRATGLTMAQIGRALNVSAATVCRALHRPQ